MCISSRDFSLERKRQSLNMDSKDVKLLYCRPYIKDVTTTTLLAALPLKLEHNKGKGRFYCNRNLFFGMLHKEEESVFYLIT